MGFSSFLSRKSGTSIPAYPYARVSMELSNIAMVLPDNTAVKEIYDGYGRIDGVDVWDIIAKFTLKRKNATRDDVFGDKKFILFDGKKFQVNEHDYENLVNLPGTIIHGMTLNALKAAGAVINTYYDKAEALIKIVKSSEFNGDKYEDLEISQSCPCQGFYYEQDADHKVISISPEIRNGALTVLVATFHMRDGYVIDSQEFPCQESFRNKMLIFV